MTEIERECPDCYSKDVDKVCSFWATAKEQYQEDSEEQIELFQCNKCKKVFD